MTDEEMREALVAALWGAKVRTITRTDSVVDALLPVVRKIAADHLRAAAKGSRPSAAWLLDRADELDPA